jgi:hypothetical protein
MYYTITSGPCQSSHSWAEVPQNSRPYFTVSFKTPQTWRARSPYLYPPGTGWPSYTAWYWAPFCRLLRLRWRDSNPPPHGSSIHWTLMFDATGKESHQLHQQFVCCSVCIRWSGKMYTEPLSSSDRLFWLHCSGFRAFGGEKIYRKKVISLAVFKFTNNEEIRLK